jgi:mRNA interferase RelE/StbE
MAAKTSVERSPVQYNVEIKPTAQKALAKIPQPHRERISKQIDRLAENPRPRGAKKLGGESSLHRIRVGEYRVVYEIHDEILLVLVVRIGTRGDVYRNLP